MSYPPAFAGTLTKRSDFHGLIKAAHTAFVNELPLVLGPDHFMLPILQVCCMPCFVVYLRVLTLHILP